MRIKPLLSDHPPVHFLEVDGLKASQNIHVISFLAELGMENFTAALEIGTQQGGFTLLVKKYLDCPVVTWDIAEVPPIVERQKLFKKYSITQRIEDCFEDPVLKYHLTKRGKKILFCDGGHKANEFNYFADYLQPGDFIAGHDYFETEAERDDDLWTTCELTQAHIQHAIDKHNLEPVYTALANKAVWALYRKP